MPTIDPFDFAPLGAFNRLHALMMCTWMRAQYFGDNGNAFYDDRVKALMGATGFQVFPRTREAHWDFPRMDLATLADGRRALCVQGTQGWSDELVGEILGSGLVHFDDWQGRVSPYFGTVAVRSFNRLPILPAGWLAAGHSLGGALVSMMGVHGAEKYFTAGQPREGDGNYADSRPNPVKLRLVNNDDPVPSIPLSSGGALDYLDLDIPFLFVGHFYRHWGQKKVLFGDGSLTFPPHRDHQGIVDVERLIRTLIETQAATHYADQYCRRLRVGFPLRFPMVKGDADFPGLFELDELNRDMNDEQEIEQWDIPGTLPQGFPVTRRRPVPPGVSPNTDPYQFLCE